MVCHVLLVETNDGLLLVDAGLGTEDMAEPIRRLGRAFTIVTRPELDRAQTAIAQIEALGFKPGDVRHIVPTHLDLDHVGGLSDFPHAKVHVFEPELRAATERRTGGERGRYRLSQVAHKPHWVPYSVDGDKWLGFDRVRVIGDDVALIPVVGHTRGHCAVLVKSERGWLLHAGDAYFFHGEVDPANPRTTVGLGVFQTLAAVDNKARKDNQRRLRELVREHGSEVRVFSAHDPRELEALASGAVLDLSLGSLKATESASLKQEAAEPR
jgi:glyoxylase-like metal-dependent hydrolase (beta-lactamase superfamily II)